MLYEKGRQYEHILTHANIHVTYVYIYIYIGKCKYICLKTATRQKEYAKGTCKRNMQTLQNSCKRHHKKNTNVSNNTPFSSKSKSCVDYWKPISAGRTSLKSSVVVGCCKKK
jgi:hypothetical protein